MDFLISGGVHGTGGIAACLLYFWVLRKKDAIDWYPYSFEAVIFFSSAILCHR